MIEDVLRDIGAIGIYGVISVVLFFLFFVGMLIWAFRLKRSYIQTMELLPLDEDPTPPHTGKTSHERE